MSNFSIYSILNEAPEDQNIEEPRGDDNFTIDTSLDDEESGGEEQGGAAPPPSDNGGEEVPPEGEEGEGEYADEEMPPEEGDEPVDSNTDIFSSLTSEEQAIKISQLKKQFSTLYTNCDDLISKISNIDTDENNIIPISRINSTMETLKTYIADYLYHTFANKSFYENDVMFNRFLSIFKSISNILEDVFKETNREIEQNNH